MTRKSNTAESKKIKEGILKRYPQLNKKELAEAYNIDESNIAKPKDKKYFVDTYNNRVLNNNDPEAVAQALSEGLTVTTSGSIENPNLAIKVGTTTATDVQRMDADGKLVSVVESPNVRAKTDSEDQSLFVKRARLAALLFSSGKGGDVEIESRKAGLGSEDTTSGNILDGVNTLDDSVKSFVTWVNGADGKRIFTPYSNEKTGTIEETGKSEFIAEVLNVLHAQALRKRLEPFLEITPKADGKGQDYSVKEGSEQEVVNSLLEIVDAKVLKEFEESGVQVKAGELKLDLRESSETPTQYLAAYLYHLTGGKGQGTIPRPTKTELIDAKVIGKQRGEYRVRPATKSARSWEISMTSLMVEKILSNRSTQDVGESRFPNLFFMKNRASDLSKVKSLREIPTAEVPETATDTASDTPIAPEDMMPKMQAAIENTRTYFESLGLDPALSQLVSLLTGKTVESDLVDFNQYLKALEEQRKFLMGAKRDISVTEKINELIDSLPDQPAFPMMALGGGNKDRGGLTTAANQLRDHFLDVDETPNLLGAAEDALAARAENLAVIEALGLESGNAQSFIDAIAKISKESDNPMNRLVAKEILDSGKALPTFKFEIISDRTVRYGGQFTIDSEGTRTISLNTDSRMFTGMEGTVLHEAIHAVTAEIIRSDRAKMTPRQRAGLQKLEKLRTQIQQEYKASSAKSGDTSFEIEYATSNLDEFVAMLFTSSTVMQEIGALPKKGLARRFINAVLDLFNIGPKSKLRAAFADLIDVVKVDPRSTSSLGQFDIHLKAAQLSAKRPSIQARAAVAKIVSDANARSNEEGFPSLDGMDSGDALTGSQSSDLRKLVDQTVAATIPSSVDVVVVDQASDAPEAFAPNPNSASVATIVDKNDVPTPVIFINRAGVADSLRKAGSVDGTHAAMILESQFTEALAHVAEFKTLTIAELDNVLNSMPDSELIDAVSDYTSDEIIAGNLRQGIADGDMNVKRSVLGEMLRMKTQMVARGFTTEQDIAFYASQPSFARVMLRYMAGIFRRLSAKYNLKKNNGELSLAVNRISDEIRMLKSGVIGGATVMRFNPNQPDSTITELNQRLTSTFGEEAEVTDGTTLEEVYNRHPHLRLVEIPLGIYDTTTGYTKNKGLRRLLRGELDPRIADINRQASGLSNAIDAKMNSTMRFILKEMEENPELDDALVADFLGRPTDIDIEDSDIARFESVYRERLFREVGENSDQGIELSKEDRAAARELAYKEEVTDKIELLKQKKVEEFKVRRDAAAAKIESISPDAIKHMRDLREQLDGLSRTFAEVFDTDGELRAVVDRNLGIYVVRAYRAFTEEGYMDRLMRLANGDESAADAQMIKSYNAAYKMFSEQHMKSAVSRKKRELREKDKSYKEADLKKEAEQFLGTVEGQKQVRAAIRNYLQSLDSNYATDSTTRLTPSASRSIVDNIRARKVIPEPIRDLLGQYSDADVAANMQRSFQAINRSITKESFIRNVVTLGTNTEAQFVYSLDELTKLEAEGRMPTGVFVNLKTGNSYTAGATPVTLNDEVETKYSVSQNYFVDKGMFDNIQSQFRPQAKATDLSSDKQVVEAAVTLARAGTGVALAAKTLGSIGFYSRNVIGNLAYFAPMQGLNPYTISKELKVLRKMLSASSAGFMSISDYEAKLMAHNVLGNDISSSMIREILDGNFEPSQADAEMNRMVDKLKKLTKKAKNSKAVKRMETQVYERSLVLSQLVDAFFKIGYFKHEVGVLEKAKAYEIENNIAGGEYATLSSFEIEAKAAKIVGETSQSYAHRYEMIKYASSRYGYLLAPFLGFKSDVVRIAFNTPRMAVNELKSDNPVIMRRGLRRISGFTFVTAGLGMVAPTLLRLAMGVGEEEDEYYRKGVPIYSKDSTFFFWRKDDGEFKVFDLTYINPQSYVTDSALRFAEGVFRGDPVGGLARAIKMLGSEFSQDQIFGSAVQDVLSNSDNITGDKIYEEDGGFGSWFKAFKYIWISSFEPRTLKAAREAGVAALGDVPEDRDKLPFWILAREFKPTKPRPVDPASSFSRYISSAKADLTRARSKVNKLKSRGGLTEGAIREIVRDYVEADKAYTLALRTGLRAGSAFGLTMGQARDVFSTKGVSKEDQVDASRGFHSVKFPLRSVADDLQGHPSQRSRITIILDELNKLPARSELDK